MNIPRPVVAVVAVLALVLVLVSALPVQDRDNGWCGPRPAQIRSYYAAILAAGTLSQPVVIHIC